MTMDEICSQLWLTDIRTVMTEDVSDFDQVITVCEEEIGELVECEYHHFNLQTATKSSASTTPDKTYDTFTQAVNMVAEYLSAGDKVLTHCHSGTSRSVAVSATALAYHKKITFETALERIQEQHPDADPSELYRNYGKRHLEMAHPTP